METLLKLSPRARARMKSLDCASVSREMEMGIMTLFGGFSDRFYAAYNEVNPLEADWKERNSIYQLYHLLNHYYLFGGSYKMQALRIAQYFITD